MKKKAKRKVEEEGEDATKLETLNKTQKKKKMENSKHSNHMEQNESLDKPEPRKIKKHKQGHKKKKKVKEMPATEECKEKAISYLKKWQKDRQNWKFEKVRQVWLLKHMLEDAKVPDSVFPILVEYLSGAKGHAREVVLEKTMEIVRVMEKYTELSEQGMNKEEIVKECPKKVPEKMYERARVILQCLQEDE